MKPWQRLYANHCFVGYDDLLHALIVDPGGYFLDDTLGIACTGQSAEGVPDERVITGLPNCIRCWKVVLT